MVALSLVCSFTSWAADVGPDNYWETSQLDLNRVSWDYYNDATDTTFGSVSDDVSYRTLFYLDERVYGGELSVTALGFDVSYNVPTPEIPDNVFSSFLLTYDCGLIVGGKVNAAYCELAADFSVVAQFYGDGFPTVTVPLTLKNGGLNASGAVTVPCTAQYDGTNTYIHTNAQFEVKVYGLNLDNYPYLSFISSGGASVVNVLPSSGSNGTSLFRVTPAVYFGFTVQYEPPPSTLPPYTIPPLDAGVPDLIPLVSEALAVTSGTASAAQRFWSFFLSYTFSPYTFYLGAAVALSFIVYAVLKDTKHSN